MAERYTVIGNRCRCHPETCSCAPWRVLKDGERFLSAMTRAAADAAAAALNVADGVPGDAVLGALLTKLPTLDPTWPEAVQDGWMRCFNALRALAAGVAPDDGIPYRATLVFDNETQTVEGVIPADALGVLAVFPAHTGPADRRVYVTCHQCDRCGHIGINDEHPTESACNRCGWHGPSPKEDRCPGCGEVGTMSTACPECGGHYVLLADADVVPSGVPASAPPGFKLVPIEAPLSLLPLLTDYDSVEHMTERDRGVILARLHRQWATLLDAIDGVASTDGGKHGL